MNIAVSIICANESSCLETVALRGVLEYFGCPVTTHWIGSSEKFIEILEGKVPVQDFVVLSSHGCEAGFYGYENELLSIENIKIHLPQATVLSLGCMTGGGHFGRFFMKGGVTTYIAPPDYPEGNSALTFATMFFWKLLAEKDIISAWKQAAVQMANEDRFSLFQRTANGMRVDDMKDVPLA